MITIKSSHPDYNLPNCVWLRTSQLSPASSLRLSVPGLGLTANGPGTVTGAHPTAERLWVCCPRVPLEPGCPEERSPHNRRLSQPAAPLAEKPPPPRTIPHFHVRVGAQGARRGTPPCPAPSRRRAPATTAPASSLSGAREELMGAGGRTRPPQRAEPPSPPRPGACSMDPPRATARLLPAAAPRSPHSRRAPVAELVGDSLDAASPRHGDIAALEAEVKAHHGHGPAAGGGPRPALARFAAGTARGCSVRGRAGRG